MLSQGAEGLTLSSFLGVTTLQAIRYYAVYERDPPINKILVSRVSLPTRGLTKCELTGKFARLRHCGVLWPSCNTRDIHLISTSRICQLFQLYVPVKRSEICQKPRSFVWNHRICLMDLLITYVVLGHANWDFAFSRSWYVFKHCTFYSASNANSQRLFLQFQLVMVVSSFLVQTFLCHRIFGCKPSDSLAF